MTRYGVIVRAALQDLKDPRGLPDWRDRSLYPKARVLSPAQWRWEFLRRAASYQEAWERCASNPCPITIRKECRRFYFNRLIEPRMSAHRVAVEDITFSGHVIETEVEQYACGIAIPYLPASFGRIPLSLYPREIAEIMAEAKSAGYLLAIIRPDEALRPQFKAIKERVALIAGKAKNTRDRVSNYPVYLRLLDARSGKSRPSLNKIAEALAREQKAGMNKDTVARLYRQAIERQTQMIRSPQIA